MRHDQSPGLSGPCHGRESRNLHLHRLRGGARLAGPGWKRETGDRAVTYEIRDDPDDLPIPCATFAEAERRGRRRAARIGSPVLIYEIDSRGGERFVGVC